MTREEIISIINRCLMGQGSQVDVASVLPKVLLAIIDMENGEVGDLADLGTDHKSDLVSAINELANLIETPNYVISMTRSASEMKKIYDDCVENIVLAKNIVFHNQVDGLFYLVNGYNIVNGVLKLHAIMSGDSGLYDVTLSLASNGTLIVE